MLHLWKFFIDKHHFTALLCGVLILAGSYAILTIPKESSPEVQIPIGIVTTVLPGASALDVEKLITNPIEDRVLGLERVSKVTSSSSDSVSVITVEFEAQADIDASIQLLKDEVDKVKSELPKEAEDPEVQDVNFADQPILIVSIAGDLAPGEITKLGDQVKDELERISGVSRVEVSGVRDREVQVIVRQDRLEQFGLTLTDVTNTLSASGVATPLGVITVDGVRYAVRLEAGITTPESVKNIALRGPGDTALTIGSVADVIDGLENPRTYSRVSVQGEPSDPALTLSVYKSRGGNIVDTGTDVKERLSLLENDLLAGTKSVISYDASDEVAHDLTELIRAGLETMVLVMIVLLLTLGWRESLVAAASVPLSFLIAFIGLQASGNTINFVSLFSLILAIGILVDSGIVVVEAIHTHLVRTGDKRKAALLALKEYAWPLIAGTFTTVAVFIPLFFLSGVTGKFIASIPFTVIFVLIASIFVALGLVPLLAMKTVRNELSPIEKRQEEYNEKAHAWYVSFLQSFLGDKKKENKFLIAMGIAFVIALMLPAFGIVKVIFFPSDDFDYFYVNIEKQQGTELNDTDLATREVEELLYQDSRIASFVSEVGTQSAFSGNGSSGSRYANITVNLKEKRKESSDEIIAELREELKDVRGAFVTISSPSAGPPTGAPVSVTFTGENLDDLVDSAEQGAQLLATIPGTTNITTSARDDGAEFKITVDTSKAAEFGVSPLVAASILRNALYGSEATTIRTGTEDIEVRTVLDLNPSYTDPSETSHTTIDAIRILSVPGAQGPVPLSAIATITYEPARSAIKHEDGERTVTLSSEKTPEGNALTIAQGFKKGMESITLPEGVVMTIGGESEDVNKSFAEMLIALIAGSLLMLAILVLEFNSFRQSLYLLSIIPLSLIGVMTGLAITGAPLSFPSMLGVIALAGVIINHAIILMDSIARIGREHPGESLRDVVIEASASRLRPIFLTTVTTVVAMIPLSLVSSLWGPLAFAVMFGLSFSMILTLLLIPVLYYRWPGKEVLARYADR